MMVSATVRSLWKIIFKKKKKKVSIYKFPYWGVDANRMYAVTKGRTITDLDRTDSFRRSCVKIDSWNN